MDRNEIKQRKIKVLRELERHLTGVLKAVRRFIDLLNISGGQE